MKVSSPLPSGRRLTTGGRHASPRFIIAFLLAALFLGVTYQQNLLAVADENFFSNWQLDTQVQVLNRIEADRLGIGVSKFGLLDATTNTSYVTVNDAGFPDSGTAREDKYIPYRSNLGIGAHFYSAFYRYTPWESLGKLRLFCAFLTALAILSLSWILARLGTVLLGGVFALCMVFSPWITAAAPNLCWSPWLWFLPAVAVGMLLLAKSQSVSRVWWAAVFFAFVAKYAFTGYEIASAITLLAMSLPLVPLIASQQQHACKKALLESIAVGACSVAAFIVTLALHALVRSGNLLRGIETIWQQDVLRRTYGPVGEFGTQYSDSLAASPVTVVYRYVTGWQTPVLDFQALPVFGFTMDSSGFWFLVLCAVGICLGQLVLRSEGIWRNVCLLLGGVLISCSWFVLAKGHSYIHTHILFFLWYLGLVPAVIFVVLSWIVERAKGVFYRGSTAH